MHCVNPWRHKALPDPSVCRHSNALATATFGPLGYEGDAGLKSCKDLARYYD